jgi:hypothetical protein
MKFICPWIYFHIWTATLNKIILFQPKSSIFLQLGLRDQWICRHSRIKNNEEKYHCETKVDKPKYSCLHTATQCWLIILCRDEVNQTSKSTKIELTNNCWANQSNRYLALVWRSVVQISDEFLQPIYTNKILNIPCICIRHIDRHAV